MQSVASIHNASWEKPFFVLIDLFHLYFDARAMELRNIFIEKVFNMSLEVIDKVSNIRILHQRKVFETCPKIFEREAKNSRTRPSNGGRSAGLYPARVRSSWLIDLVCWRFSTPLFTWQGGNAVLSHMKFILCRSLVTETRDCFLGTKVGWPVLPRVQPAHFGNAKFERSTFVIWRETYIITSQFILFDSLNSVRVSPIHGN